MNKITKSWVYNRFSKVFQPATFLMMRLNFAKRALVLAIIATLTFSFISYNFYLRLQQVVEASEKGLAGLEMLTSLFKTVQMVQEHRGLTAGVLGGTTTLEGERLSKQKQVDASFDQFADLLPIYILKLDRWKKIMAKWSFIKDKGMSLSREDNFSQQTVMVDQLLLLSQKIADDYALTNHPDLAIYYIFNTTIQQLSGAQEFLGQTRAFGTGILAKKQSTELQKVQISTLIAQTDKAVHSLQYNLEKTARYNPAIKSTLIQSSDDVLKTSQRIFELLKSDILHEKYLTAPEEFFQIMTDAIDKSYLTMYQVLLPTTTELINQRQSEVKQLLAVMATILVFAFFIIIYFFVGIYIATIKSIDSISNTTLGFARGDLTSRIPINPQSEFKVLAESFNHMADELLLSINTEREDKARISSIIDSAHDALIQIDEKSVITGWCRQAEHIFGWKAIDILGKSLLETLIPERSQKAHIRGIERFLEHKDKTWTNGVREVIALHHDGHELPVELSVAAVQTKSGYEFNAFIRDITERKNSENSLKSSEKRFHTIFTEAPLGLAVIDSLTAQIYDANPAYSKIAGRSIEELRQLDWTQITHPDDTHEDLANMSQMNTEKTNGFVMQKRFIQPDGTVRWVNMIITPMQVENKSAPRHLCMVEDISEKKQIEEKQQLAAKVFEDTKEGIIITDENTIIIDTNPAFCDITGYTREEVIGQPPSILRSEKQPPLFYKEMWHSIKTVGYWQGEVWNRKKTGELYAELLSISSLRDDLGGVLHYVGIFSDITHSKNQQDILEQMAHYDALTQLPNRVLLNDRFIQALAHCKRQENLLAVCFLDLDNFKPVNDLYGHDTGDQLLIDVAQRIKTIIRDEDTLSRQGGDEFVLLLGGVESFSHCEKMLQRITLSLAQPYIIDRQSISISASIGVTLYPIDDSDCDTLMRHADQAMYKAKTSGRNRYQLFNTEQDQLETKKITDLEEIQQALGNNELRLYYQPKVDMATGEVFGAEALIRWIHPEKGLIPPLKFLPVIEETKLEIEIGNWVISQALKHLNEWQQQGIKLEVSVNISSYHLQCASFLTDLEADLSLYPEVSSKNLQLEILESSALGDLNTIAGIINTCINTLGVNVALDDFGTGYSSLMHLRHLPVDTIKIDQTFVRDVLDDPSDYTIIDGVIGLADSFGLDVIAEGVETMEHGLMLLIMGCNKAQGYGIAKPMPSHELSNWLANYTPNDVWKSWANKNHSDKENVIKLFRLAITEWQKHFEKNMHSLPGDIKHWPILKRTKCHCGTWVKRVKKEKIFEEKWIEKLAVAHDAMHDIADDLFNHYQEGQVVTARDELSTFQKAAENMLNILGQYE